MERTLLPAAETRWISERARDLGFALCGVAPAARFPELARYPEWLERGYAGEMNYLADPRRLDPRLPLPGAESLVVCALNYNSERPYSTEAGGGESLAGWISRYAWGRDYHPALWTRLNTLVDEMRCHFPEPFLARAYADSGPVHERAAAKYAGLGWLGKNTLLIHQTLGSWLFLGVILTDLPLAPSLGPLDAPPPDRCGSCRACLDACPTQAIVEPYLLDASRCISYLTIELRGPVPEELREPMGRHVFGCDICQDVCPWNRKSPRSGLPEFEPRASAPGGWSTFLPDLVRLAALGPEEFREAFRGSAVKRAKWQGLVRNASIALGNARPAPDHPAYSEVLSTLGRLAGSSEPAVSESARWALSRIQGRGGGRDGPEAATGVS